jgi:hypothetical protein
MLEVRDVYIDLEQDGGESFEIGLILFLVIDRFHF